VFGVSDTGVNGFGVSDTDRYGCGKPALRGIRHRQRLSGFQTLLFGVSDTEIRGFRHHQGDERGKSLNDASMLPTAAEALTLNLTLI
jgi:hypothetical protein